MIFNKYFLIFFQLIRFHLLLNYYQLMANCQNKVLNGRTISFLPQVKNNCSKFKVTKQFSKQLCDSIALSIQGESILIFNNLEIFFNQIIKILQKSLRSARFKIKDYINVDYNLKTIYFAIQNKLLLLKQYPDYQKNKEQYLQCFPSASKLVSIVRKLIREKKLKQFQIFNRSNILETYKSDKDIGILKYLKIKLSQPQKTNSLQEILKQYIFEPIFSSQKYLKQFQIIDNQSFKKINHLSLINYGNNQNVSKSNCIMCSKFFLYNVNIGAERNLSSDIVLFESVKKMRDVEQNRIKQQIVAFSNSDRPGIILFDCFQHGLEILARGWYMTEKTKQSYEQTFCSLIDSIEPKLQINKDFKIQFVPVKQQKKLGKIQFLAGVYVMRIKITPSRISQTKLFKCKIDGKTYCYVRQGKKNISISQNNMKEQSAKRIQQYSFRSSNVLRCQGYVSENFHYGPCSQPQTGRIQYQYNRINADYFMNLLNYRIELQSEAGTALQSCVLIVASGNWKQPLHQQFQQLGIKNNIQNLYKNQFKIAQSTLVMRYNGKYQKIQDTIKGEQAKKKNYLRIGNKQIITIHVCNYLKIIKYKLNHDQVEKIKEKLKQQNFQSIDFKIWQDPSTKETYISSESKDLLIFLYLKYKQYFKSNRKTNDMSEINFKNPEQPQKLIELIFS